MVGWPDMRIGAISILFAMALLPIGSGHPAYSQPARCSLPQAKSSYPAVAKTIGDWQVRTKVGLSKSVADSVEILFCDGAREVSAQLGLSASNVDAKAEVVVSRYLDESLQQSDAVSTMTELIGRQFAAGGLLSYPEPKRFGLINFTFKKNVDQVSLNDDLRSPALQIMVPVGSTVIKGIVSRNVVCQATVSVNAFPAVSFEC